MLSASRRIHRSGDFTVAVRRGHRVRRGVLVAHVAPRPASSTPRQLAMTQCGFIVSKAVGNSVVRHQITRRLRHLCHDRYAALPTESVVVLRALPASANVSFAELQIDFDRITEAMSRG